LITPSKTRLLWFYRDKTNNSLKKRYTSTSRDYILTFSVFDDNYLSKNIIENDPKKSVIEQSIYDF